MNLAQSKTLFFSLFFILFFHPYPSLFIIISIFFSLFYPPPHTYPYSSSLYLHTYPHTHPHPIFIFVFVFLHFCLIREVISTEREMWEREGWATYFHISVLYNKKNCLFLIWIVLWERLCLVVILIVSPSWVWRGLRENEGELICSHWDNNWIF